MLVAGSKIGPYTIVAALGKGGMGEVYRAHDDRLGRDVAIKIIPEYLASDSLALKRFEREAKSLAALSHPNIVTIHDVGRHEQISFVVMELLEGQTLRQSLWSGALPWDQALQIGINIAEGLAAAHSKGVIHRDLKPENIFLTSDGRVKILDFGLAKQEQSVQQLTQAPTASAPVTESLTVLGTIPYMSPEQLKGADLDARTDLFSFGSILYEMISGARAFSGETLPEIAASILKDSPHKLEKPVPQEMERVIFHCLEKNPKQRFQNSQDLCFALRAIQDSAKTKTLQRVDFAVGKKIGIAVAALIALTIIGLLLVRDRVAQHQGIESLAILPFENVSKDPENEYLSEGITERLINTLGQISNLKVIAQSSVSHYKGKEMNPRLIGKELNVEAVLMGKVNQRGEDLLVSAELIDVNSNTHLWGDRYSRSISDVLIVQEEISRQISERLKYKLSGEAEKRFAKRDTQNQEAYQLYMKGRYYWNRRTPEESRKAIQYFQEAIQKDSGYAAAYAGMSDAYRMMDEPVKAREMAVKALELDNKLPEAHTALGRIKLNHDWDLKSTEEHCTKAIEENPNDAEAHHTYSHALMAAGRPQESYKEAKIAIDLAPLDLAMQHHLAWYYIQTADFSAGYHASLKSLELDPDHFYSLLYAGVALTHQGKYNEGVSYLEKAHMASPNSREGVTALAYCYAVSGKKQKARELLKQWTNPESPANLDACQIGTIYGALGDFDQAFAWLNKSLTERCLDMIYWKSEPFFNPLRQDPRFKTLTQKIGF